MAKGYWIAHIEVKDPERYKDYVAAAAPAFAAHGAKFLARSGRWQAMEGKGRARNVVIEFPSFEAAKACYESEQYQKAHAIRVEVSEAELILVEGLEG